MSQPAQILTPRQQATLKVLRDDIPEYGEQCLKINPKGGGGLVPMKLNRVQQYIHDACEDQKRRIGFVRKILVKGRQQTCSTYVAERFFHDAQMFPGINVFILSHEAKSTKALFAKVETFNDNLSKDFVGLAHGIVTENSTEMKFTNGSTYGVGTAGAATTGRGLTIMRLHGSECAFWDNAEQIRAGVLQTVADIAGTEIILESTCNGMNWWYEFCMSAVRKEGLYELEFIPWFWTDEYRLPVPPDFERTTAEQKVSDVVMNGPYNDGYELDDEQLYWRRVKIQALGSLRMFKQEYPCTLDEAFQASGQPYYDADLLEIAFNNKNTYDPIGALVIGVDPGRKGDRTVITYRRGRVIERFRIYKHGTTATQLAGILKDIIDFEGADKVFIDFAIGTGTIDILNEDGYGEFIEGVDFGQSPLDDQYENKRAEMACLFNSWMVEGEVAIRTEDENQRRDVKADILMMPDFRLTANSRKLFPPKEQMRKDFGRSPDILDSIMLTFASPVRPRHFSVDEKNHVKNMKGVSSLTARNRVKQVSNDVEVIKAPQRTGIRRFR